MLYTAQNFDNKDIRQLYFGLTNANVSKEEIVSLPVVSASHATFATAQTNLATALQTALRTIEGAGIVKISEGIVWDSVGAVWQGWAIITYNPA